MTKFRAGQITEDKGGSQDEERGHNLLHPVRNIRPKIVSQQPHPSENKDAYQAINQDSERDKSSS
jgi:hypothetical protein